MSAEHDCERPRAAVVLVGTELVSGLTSERNGEVVTRALVQAGYRPSVREVLPDDVDVLAERLATLTRRYPLVVVTGGLGPTHDDLTREAAAAALGLALRPDAEIASRLGPVIERHVHPDAADQILRQAEVLEGATVLAPDTGTAPGQLVSTRGGRLLLLPGPPHELAPMLEQAAELIRAGESASPTIVSCVDLAESDAQLRAQSVLAGEPGIGLTVLARPALVDIVLFDEGAGTTGLAAAALRVAEALGDACYATDGSTLAETVIGEATQRGIAIAVAESCTGGMIGAELTAVPGASAVFLASAVTYADSAKQEILHVSEATLRAHGAVSAECASEMAAGIRRVTEADIALSVTGIAGPAGASPGKPRGTVWFGLADGDNMSLHHRVFSGDRSIVRARSTVIALDLLRRALLDRRPGTP